MVIFERRCFRDYASLLHFADRNTKVHLEFLVKRSLYEPRSEKSNEKAMNRN